MSQIVPVIIVGGGPVGLTLSLDLSRRGIRNILICDAPGTSTHPKCNTTNARSMEHFRRLGVASRIRFGGLPADYPTDIVYTTRLGGAEIARIKFPSPREASNGGSETPEPQHRISQIYLEEILLEAATAEPNAEIYFATRATRFEDKGSHVRVEVIHLSSGKTKWMEARWLVGCDGARSTVRKQCGIGYTGTSSVKREIFGGTMVATYFRSPELRSILTGHEGFMYWTLNPTIRSVTVAIDGDQHFLTHVQVPDGVEADAIDLRNLLPAIVGRAVDIDICSSASWNAGFRLVAEEFRKGRFLLAGDAAHLFTPTGGFGMNTGIDDVANLAWKLAAVEEGWGGPALLDSYGAERRPVAFRNTAAASDIADVITGFAIPEQIEAEGDEGNAARALVARSIQSVATEEFLTVGVQLGVRYEDSPIIIPDGTEAPPDLRTQYVPTARPGSRLPHFADEEGVPVYDRLGIGFSLLIAGGDRAAAEAAVDSLATPVVIVALDPSRAASLGARFLLVRPDQHVAWRGDDLPADFGAIVAIACGNGE
ncbi:FAD-dependent monooxygenase [Accumulibacter sp.]|uniref:FAD-dependent monooxygenase n=1 Tax=Accumulibacter sp. TaxID=2053492 RepID=UPI002634EFA3|nr:FAD-dependent monooxygenase [Accumulibacter sp.]